MTMTYGTLPTREQFDAAFEAECPTGYAIRLSSSDSRAVDGFKLGDGTWEAGGLWAAITEIVNAEGDDITVWDASPIVDVVNGEEIVLDEMDDCYEIYYPCTDRPYVEIGPNAEELTEWAQKFSESAIESKSRAVECLNFAAAYGEVGKCYMRRDAALDLVGSIMETLGFEWV